MTDLLMPTLRKPLPSDSHHCLLLLPRTISLLCPRTISQRKELKTLWPDALSIQGRCTLTKTMSGSTSTWGPLVTEPKQLLSSGYRVVSSATTSSFVETVSIHVVHTFTSLRSRVKSLSLSHSKLGRRLVVRVRGVDLDFVSWAINVPISVLVDRPALAHILAISGSSIMWILRSTMSMRAS